MGLMTPRRHVLIVDDDDDIRALLAATLSMQGYSITTASNGATALDLVRHEAPDVIVLDLMMPDVDGETFVEICRSEGLCQDAQLIVISAADRASLARRLGAPRFLAKPFDLDDLIDAVAT